jgi:uncharacterized membrane protein (DUF485 family)
MTINEMGREASTGAGALTKSSYARPTADGAGIRRARGGCTHERRAIFEFGEETKMDDTTVKRIQSDPNYQKLVAERKSFGWTLAIITLVIYYGFIALVAFAPSVIAIPVAGSITVGLILGVAIIIASIVLTGIYVARANSHYDDLTKAIVNAAAMGGK